MSRRGSNEQIVTANRLSDGRVVYLKAEAGSHSWYEDIGDASVVGVEEIAGLLKIAEGDVATNDIVDPYAVDIADDHRVPVTQREAVRAGGPTIAYGVR